MQVGFIGSGNMASALARGWGDPVLASDSGSGRAQTLVDELGGERLSNAEVFERADLVILAHKPYQLEQVAGPITTEKPIVSILGRATVAEIEAVYPSSPVIRVEPNTPAAVRRGVTVLAASERPEAATVRALFERVGTVVEVPERLLDVAGAVTGVGPAFWALFVEAYTDSAVRHGIPAAQAATLVTETMAGTAALLTQTDTLSLRRGVTSPGGSTARGLAALERGGVRAAVAQAMDDVVGG
ncbi:pyrroline-5-carboxylate reductase [Solirubrobacter sp. CPCC 204708]|uniref:Pyrroline-5-carboxylate reductase n=1 Tax=Solirubrobacter deserti TaxID=2282478 RepID=A0ABT4RS37_9ACTN|nr:pyrroline-5-carboxylate reductase [Solirubrobacter deserti]MBE2315104.1 pyrroline-5-carboxylate reductase [Solirubrobacter deserti]MDA0141374.1 pyrroline-5-carboxylate reductase [Solirubrobacter deserti]